MTRDAALIDDMLAAVLRGQTVAWPGPVVATADALERILYHGVAGLIADRTASVADWPAAILVAVRDQAVALAMWELRHKAVLSTLLGNLSKARIDALLLKGTALAYDLYPSPATRARGDSDLLIAPADLAAARVVFARLGYRRQPLDEGIADDLALQEVWSLNCEAGTRHHIDLHWQLINAPALRGLLEFSDCATDPLPLPRLDPEARAMNRPLTLLHSCVHRAMHLTSPYFVNGVTFHGGDRLIWAKDIDLLAAAMTEANWSTFTAMALSQGVAAVCFDGLRLAERTLGSSIPHRVAKALGTAGTERASTYLLRSAQARRAWLDLRAIAGWRRKLAYVAARSVPSERFMRTKYPDLAARPLALLYLQRMIDLIRPRPRHGARR